MLAAWTFAYACYRAYYAMGGTFGQIGQPVSAARLQAVNALGAAVVLVAAIVPVAALRIAWLDRAMPVLGWCATVGCGMHALVDGVLRAVSLTGVHPTQLPANVWRSFDRRSADLQDLLLNEPWFLITGLLWAVFALAFVRQARRRAWLMSAMIGVAALTAIGVLSGLGVLPTFHVG